MRVRRIYHRKSLISRPNTILSRKQAFNRSCGRPHVSNKVTTQIRSVCKGHPTLWLGDRALERSAGGLRHGGGGSGFRILLTTGPPERIAVGEEVEDGGERRAGARRAGEGGMCTARWQGVVRETSPMPGRQQPRCHRRGEAPLDAPMSSRGTLPRGEEVVCRPPPRHNSSSAA